MKIAILGGLGYIGQVLIKNIYMSNNTVRLLNDDFSGNFRLKNNLINHICINKDKITIFDNDFLGYSRLKNETPMTYVKFKYTDLTKEIPDLKKFDVVINLAGITMTYSTDEKAVNAINYKAAIECAKKSKRYIFISTNNLHGGRDIPGVNITENEKPCPTGCYAKSKANVEYWLKKNHKNYCIIRFGSCYGWSPSLKYAPINNIFILDAILKDKIDLFGAIDESRPAIHVNDAVITIVHVINNKLKGIYASASSNETLRDRVEIIKTVMYNKFKRKIKLNIKPSKNFFKGYNVSTDKLKKTGFGYNYTLIDAVQELYIKFRK